MSKARIMIVEDAGVVALSLQHRLERFGYEIPVIVSSGEEALDEILRNDLDLVLMDIRLEGEMDGIETAQKIKEKDQIPIIYLTAHSDEKTLDRAKITEPYGYILKPYEDRELYSTIEMALYKNRMEKKLRESEQWLSTTLNSIGDGVIATGPEGLIRFMNPVAEMLTGWRLRDAVERYFADILIVMDSQTAKSVANPAIKTLNEGTVVGIQTGMALLSRGNEKIPIEMNAAPIKNSANKIIGIVIVFRDVSERRTAEEARVQKEKLEAILQMAGTVCHEMASPMHAAIGYIELLAKQTGNDDAIKEKVDKILKLLRKMGDILKKLRNITTYKTTNYLDDVKIVDINVNPPIEIETLLHKKEQIL